MRTLDFSKNRHGERVVKNSVSFIPKKDAAHASKDSTSPTERFMKNQEDSLGLLGRYNDVLLLPNLTIPNLSKQPKVDLLIHGKIEA